MRSLECKRNQDPSELNEWDYNDAKQRQEYFERELRIWKKLKHPTILPLLESFETVHRMYTVSRYCLEGNALGLMQRSIPRGGVDMLLVRHIVKCTAVALQYMHNEARIIHGDVKLENIFLDPDKEAEYGYRVYVSDFGLAQEMDTSDAMSSTQEREEEAPLSGSIPYCSPERLQAIEPQLTQAMDAWGLGVVAYALVFSQLPFHDDYEPRLVMKILEAEIDWGCPRKDISTALDCIAKLLLVDVDERWSIHQALTSLWLS
jgi:serine/threonine protein kinase